MRQKSSTPEGANVKGEFQKEARDAADLKPVPCSYRDDKHAKARLAATHPLAECPDQLPEPEAVFSEFFRLPSTKQLSSIGGTCNTTASTSNF